MTDSSEIQEYHQHQDIHGSHVTIDEYEKPLITPIDWAKETFAHPIPYAIEYLRSLFPIHRWILHYNLSWLYADVVAGITVGIVVVPQSMSYAQIALLSPQYGLYSAFVGVFIYCFFATSKDVSIGPVAVMSLEVSKVITKVQKKDPTLSGPVIATSLSLICGAIALGIGILRLGFLLEFISTPAVFGFMSGSAFSIIVGQVPSLLGYNKKVNTREATYKVVINTLKNLKFTKLDAVFGLIPLLILYVWKFSADAAPKKYPKTKTFFFFFQALRNGIVIIVFTCISWGMIRHHKDEKTKPISILGTVPSGLRDVGAFHFPPGIMATLGPELPASIIVLLLEHIAISKSFGRVNDYKIVPDQEVIAIGVTNLIGTLFHAYPATGSFSRSALKAKCNVKTPLAGLFTGACVLLALYCLTGAFYYIPKATLSAVIIHAVSDLIAQYSVPLFMYKISPIDSGIFIVAVFITVFSSIENGIYFAICASAAQLLFKIAKPTGHFLGRVQVSEVINPTIIKDDSSDSIKYEVDEISIENSGKKQVKSSGNAVIKYHTKWVPLTKSVVNSNIKIKPAPPGVLVYRLNESFTYINSSNQYDTIFDEIRTKTRKGEHPSQITNINRPWNDPGPLRLPWRKATEEVIEADTRPLLNILVLDFTQVNQIDSTSIQALIDLKKAVNKYTNHEVEFHFVGIYSEWIKRALINVGFGIGSEFGSNEVTHYEIAKNDEEFNHQSLIGTNTPYFHLDFPNFDYLDEEEYKEE
ncbi:hypothetical protein WICMUC_005965 [Wickerhamomyces mucosus]|uniref:STAS domain-containing protein n=1 Tax=Wickerhamomyces mucosus TaxID=1378264 RepID=A0A9P8T2R3_9ASCO|nr:hypothetical protein WICMUC_005965 [Wickerhamomyces mucosus]